MKIAVTVKKCVQTGYDSFSDYYTTKVFDMDSTLNDILTWARTINKHETIGTLHNISDIVE